MALAQELREEELITGSIEQQLRTINQLIGELTQKIEVRNSHEKDIRQVEALLQSVMEKQERNDRQLAQALKEEAVFKKQVREGMKQELDGLKEQQSGEQFNPLLKEIAAIYVEYHGLLEDESPSQQFRRNLKALFEQLEDVLGDYGAEVCRSEEGAVRQTGLSKVIEKIATHNQEEHNIIAVSRRPGVVRGKMVLAREFVDVYVYDSSLKNADPEKPVKEEEILEETESDVTDKKNDFVSSANEAFEEEESKEETSKSAEEENQEA